MKKKMRKLWAVLLAVAMVFSLATTALAGENGEEEEDTPASVTELPTNGHASGGSRSEGPYPDDPVEVVLPTIPTHPDGGEGGEDGEGGGGVIGVFDMYLDPHSLIQKTNSARYNTDESVTNNFAEGNKRLFFLKSFTEDGATRNYDNETYPLSITNKGRQPVNVDLTVEFTYEDFTLVNDMTLLEKDEDGNPVAGAPDDAAMYLALRIADGDEEREKTVVISDPSVLPEEPGDDATDDETAAYEAAYEAKYQPLYTIEGVGDYLTFVEASGTGDDAVEAAPAVAFDWGDETNDDTKAAILETIDDLSITVTYNDPKAAVPASGEGEDAVEAQDAVDASFTVAGDFGEDYAIVVDAGDFDAEAITEAGSVDVNIMNGDDTLATVTLQLKAPDRRVMKATTEDDDNSQTVKFKAPFVGAIMHTAIEGNLDAYDEAWYDAENAEEGATEPQGMTTAGYYWKLNEEKTDFPTLTFKLFGNINDDVLWDAKNTEPGITFNIIWDVFARNDANSDVAYGNSEVQPLENDDGNNNNNGPTGDLPTVEVTKKATGTSSTTTKTATITWTPGTDDYAVYEPEAVITLSTGSTLTMTIDSDAHTMTNKNAAGIGSGTYGTVTFKDPNGVLPDYEVDTTALR